MKSTEYNYFILFIVDDMTAARHFIKTQLKQMDEEMLFSVLQPQLKLNPKFFI